MDEIKASIMDTLEDKRTMEALRKINPQEIAYTINDAGMLNMLEDTLSKLCEMRPDEKGKRSRQYAITIVEMEKVVSYFKMFVVNGK